MNATLAVALGLSLATAPSFALVTYGSPHQYEVAAVGGTPWSLFDGVAHLVLTDAQGEASACSGAVLWSGGHLLTAAHCLYDTVLGFEAVSASIHLPALGFSTTVAVDRRLAHHDWTGDVSQGYDLAVIPLGTQVAAGYGIDRTGVGMFSLGTDDPPYLLMAGYGLSGSGALDGTLYPAGTLRAGFNQYDALWTDVPRAPYKFDFDDYTAAHNATGRNGTGFIPGYGEHWVEVDWDFSGDPVRGEAMIAPGDSGGPSFLDSILVGIHSFINTSAADGDAVINASFGEVAADTRVFLYADWIDARVAGAVPEPEAGWLMLAGMAGLWARRRQRSASI